MIFSTAKCGLHLSVTVLGVTINQSREESSKASVCNEISFRQPETFSAASGTKRSLLDLSGVMTIITRALLTKCLFAFAAAERRDEQGEQCRVTLNIMSSGIRKPYLFVGQPAFEAFDDIGLMLMVITLPTAEPAVVTV